MKCQHSYSALPNCQPPDPSSAPIGSLSSDDGDSEDDALSKINWYFTSELDHFTLGTLRNHDGNGTSPSGTERHQTEKLMRRTITVRMRYNSWLISLPSSARQKREMPNSASSGERAARRLIFWIFYFKFIAVFRIEFCDSFDSDAQTKWLYSIARFVGKIYLSY